jgi:hypothetical protein
MGSRLGSPYSPIPPLPHSARLMWSTSTVLLVQHWREIACAKIAITQCFNSRKPLSVTSTVDPSCPTTPKGSVI